MDIHKNASTTVYNRAEIVRRISAGTPTKVVAESFGVCEKTVRKWWRRFAAEGAAGLNERRSRPKHLYRPTAPELVAQVLARRSRW